MNRRLLTQKDLPEFEPVPLTLAMLVAEGMRLVKEQELVNTSKLGEEYMVSVLCWGGGGGSQGGVTTGALYGFHNWQPTPCLCPVGSSHA
jgi:hypothetical protein